MSFDNWMQIVPGEILPVPADYLANDLIGMLFTIWAGGFGLAVLPWALYRYLKHKDDVPGLMCIGGFISSLLEPMLDHLGHLWWPTNLPGPAFMGFDLNIPYLIPPCYVFFIAMTGYWAYLRMKSGLDMKGVFVVWLIISMSDVIMEIPGTMTGAYTYYGDASFKILGFPLAWGWMNGTSMLLVGFLLWLVNPYLAGLKRLYIILVPITAMGAAYGMVSWPYFMSLNWDMPWIATRVLTVVSLLIALVVVGFVGAMVARTKSSTNPLPNLGAVYGQ